METGLKLYIADLVAGTSAGSNQTRESTKEAHEHATVSALGVGLYDDVPAAVYHADPCEELSLSSSLACTLHYHLPAHAWLQHPRLNPNHGGPRKTPAMTQGTLVHALLSNDADSIVIGPYDNIRLPRRANGATALRQRQNPGVGEGYRGRARDCRLIRRHAGGP